MKDSQNGHSGLLAAAVHTLVSHLLFSSSNTLTHQLLAPCWGEVGGDQRHPSPALA